jgi:hypothetical protein
LVHVGLRDDELRHAWLIESNSGGHIDLLLVVIKPTHRLSAKKEKRPQKMLSQKIRAVFITKDIPFEPED